MSLFVPHHKPIKYFTLHDGGTCQLLVRMDDGAICSVVERTSRDWTYPDPKQGWELPLWCHMHAIRVDDAQKEWTTQARVLCAIMAAVQDLPENHTARVAVLESSIHELAEDALANLVPECRRPAGSFPVFEALGKVLEAITICEEHP